jgi:hypothetical protein
MELATVYPRVFPTLGVWAPSGGACALDPRKTLVLHLFWAFVTRWERKAHEKHPEQVEHQCVSGDQRTSAPPPRKVPKSNNDPRNGQEYPVHMGIVDSVFGFIQIGHVRHLSSSGRFCGSLYRINDSSV